MITSRSKQSSENFQIQSWDGNPTERHGKPWFCSQIKKHGKRWFSSRSPFNPSFVGLSVRTAPLNWIVEILRQSERTAELIFGTRAHLDKLEHVDLFIKNNYPDYHNPLLLEQIRKDLRLLEDDDTSAWSLTMIKKHPSFQKAISANSIKSLKKGNSIGQISTKQRKTNKATPATNKQRNAPTKIGQCKRVHEISQKILEIKLPQFTRKTSK